jgi:ribonuclease HII
MTDARYVIGVDEVGCGAIAGPLVVAAVAFRADAPRVTAEWRGVRGVKTLAADDSKKIKVPEQRGALDLAIRTAAVAHAVIERSAAEIDARLLREVFPEALRLAIQRCVEQLMMTVNPGKFHIPKDDLLVLIDGDLVRPDVPCPVRMVPGGDALDWRIGAASIVAKACHDRHVARIAGEHPEWAFDKHRGYPTPKHLDQLHRDGLLDQVHRRTFGPVRASRGPIPGMEE